MAGRHKWVDLKKKIPADPFSSSVPFLSTSVWPISSCVKSRNHPVDSSWEALTQ